MPAGQPQPGVDAVACTFYIHLLIASLVSDTKDGSAREQTTRRNKMLTARRCVTGS
jgi:hypothetical protein